LNPEAPIDINSISAFTLGDGKKAWYEKVGGKPFDEYTPREVAALLPRVHEAFTKAHPDSVFVKTHNVLGATFDIPLITMEYTAGAIYIIRNPLDTVISLADHFGLSLDDGIAMLNNPKAIVHQTDDKNRGLIEQLFGSWSGHISSWMAFNRQYMHLMRYEDMLEKPEETFGEMVKFLGLNPPEERLKKAIEFSSFDVMTQQESEKGFIEQSDKNEKFFRSGKSGQWKKVLTGKQVKKIVNCHYDAMKYFGYLPD
jgi:hypothetical protein